MGLNLKKIKALKVIITTLLVITFTVSVISCKEEMIEEETVKEEEEEASDETGNEMGIDSPETKPVEEEVVEKIDVPEIPGLTFNQETRKYLNEAGVEVGVYVEDAIEINGKMENAVGLAPEEIRKILNENKEKGIFECPWPINFQENKDLKIVELIPKQLLLETDGIYLANDIGIKYSKPVNLYAPFDASDDRKYKYVDEYIPDKEEDPDFFSAQAWKSITLFSEFGYKSEEADYERKSMIHCMFVDWDPLVKLGEPYIFGNNDLNSQDIIEEIRYGDLLGVLLPRASDFDSLDFAQNEEFYENPGEFQAVFRIYDFFDDTEGSSSLKRILRFKEGSQEVTVFIWPGDQKTAHEQNK